jgi:hypothetical protein
MPPINPAWSDWRNWSAGCGESPPPPTPAAAPTAAPLGHPRSTARFAASPRLWTGPLWMPRCETWDSSPSWTGRPENGEVLKRRRCTRRLRPRCTSCGGSASRPARSRRRRQRRRVGRRQCAAARRRRPAKMQGRSASCDVLQPRRSASFWKPRLWATAPGAPPRRRPRMRRACGTTRSDWRRSPRTRRGRCHLFGRGLNFL